MSTKTMRLTKLPEIVGSSSSGSSDRASVITPGWPEAGPDPHPGSAMSSRLAASVATSAARTRQRCVPLIGQELSPAPRDETQRGARAWRWAADSRMRTACSGSSVTDTRSMSDSSIFPPGSMRSRSQASIPAQ